MPRNSSIRDNEMESYIKFIVRYRFIVLGLLLLITLLSGVVLSGVKMTGSLAGFMVAIIAIGIAVDDTIHFLFRYRI